jgi:hypothetical protein
MKTSKPPGKTGRFLILQRIELGVPAALPDAVRKMIEPAKT